MMAVIFEVWPASGRKDDYLKMAAALRSEVEQIDGFISVERFESLYEEGKLLSLQFWRDDKAIGEWRRQLEVCSGLRLRRLTCIRIRSEWPAGSWPTLFSDTCSLTRWD